MTLATTYMSDLSRVRLAATAIPATTDYVKFERSTDGIVWKTVRGGDAVQVVASAATLDDYGFSPGKINTYRATYIDTQPLVWVGSSGPFSGNNASLAVAYNGSTVNGDTILLFATIRNTAATVNTPSGWTVLVSMGNAVLFGKIQDGAAAPTVTFSGGAAGDDTTAQTTTYRNMQLTPLSLNTQTNGSAQNIAVPALGALAQTPSIVIALGWKQDDWTGSPTITGFVNELGNTPVTAGNDAGHVWWTKPKTTLTSEPTNTYVITGGAAAVSKAAQVAFGQRANTGVDTQTITPAPTDVYLKNPQRPGLNTKITVTGIGDITRPARTSVVDVLGRTYPVAITDVQGSRQLTITVTVPDLAAYQNLDNLLLTGEPLMLQGPSDLCDVPSMYVVVGDTRGYRNSKRAKRRYFDLPLVEVAEPSGSVAGSTITWNDVVATYATWNDVVAAFPDWSSLVSAQSSAVVVVP